jgi:DNA-binding NtrC family response regulator
MSKKSLLLVNDEETVQQVLAAMLAGTHWQIEPAFNGEQALRLYDDRGPYDLVITDIDHPGPDGVEVVTLVRKANPGQAVAIVSAYSSQSPAIRCLNVPVLAIPFEREQFVEFVESCIG